MCTLVILRRPGHEWPLIVAANRDEMRDRPWSAPGRHWPDRPEVVAGIDHLGGGSWLGVNDHGLVAAVMNREGTLGPQKGMRSRGELVLEALDHAEAAQAAHALEDLDPCAYRAFNLFVGDPVTGFWLRSRGGAASHVECREVPSGVHLLSARDLDDTSTARIRVHLPRFQHVSAPDPGAGEWEEWRALLANRMHPAGEGLAAMNVDLASGFGTVCSHLLAVPRYPGPRAKPVFLFAAGAPDQVPFEPVAV